MDLIDGFGIYIYIYIYTYTYTHTTKLKVMHTRERCEIWTRSRREADCGTEHEGAGGGHSLEHGRRGTGELPPHTETPAGDVRLYGDLCTGLGSEISEGIQDPRPQEDPKRQIP